MTATRPTETTFAGPANLVEAAASAARAGAAVALQWWHRRAQLDVRSKNDPDDLVSDADVHTQTVVGAELARLRPGDGVQGEEGGAGSATSATGLEWWVDPIDGTTSFLYGRADWAVSVACIEASTGRIVAAAVAEPVLGLITTAGSGGGVRCDGERVEGSTCAELSRALVDVNLGRAEQRGRAGAMVAALTPRVRDLRRGGSAAAALAQLATGRTDAVWVPGLQAWDGAAGVLLAVEAGAIVGDLDGRTGARWPSSGDVLAAPEALWDELQSLLKPVYRPS
jgi:myo-inositol-1(or 4)-monophosphatase